MLQDAAPRLALRAVLLLAAAVAASQPLQAASIVRFETVLGDIDVRLFETATPASVANFLNYVADEDYDDSYIHRAPPNFVVQGGGFRWPEGGDPGTVPTDPPVVNEPGLTNIRGTLAYAKVGGDPNSATSGWFFSIQDNAANLDLQNGGFTVFGRIIGNGLQVIDAINALQRINADGFPILDTAEPPTVERDEIVLIETVRLLSIIDGDYDFDGDVDQQDLAVWQSQFGSSLRIEDQAIATSSLVEADGNGDGVVDAADYTIWRDAFNASSSALAVPEPTAWLLATVAGLGVVSLRRSIHA